MPKASSLTICLKNEPPGENGGFLPNAIELHKDNILQDFGDAAVQVIDDYLTDGNEDSLFSEPEFLKSKDLNSFLKSEKLGKGDEFSPKLKTQIAMARKIFRKSLPVQVKNLLHKESN